MSSRNPVYIVGVGLFVLMFSAPQIVLSLAMASRGDMILWHCEIPGIGPTKEYWAPQTNATFWRDEFVTVGSGSQSQDGKYRLELLGWNPETGVETDRDLAATGRTWYRPTVVNDRLWIVGPSDSFEVVDGRAVPSKLTGAVSEFHFLWNGEPAALERSANECVVAAFEAGAWTGVATVIFPAADRIRMVGDIPVDFARLEGWDCRQYDDRLHLFIRANGLLLYREGFEFRRGLSTSARAAFGFGPSIPQMDEPVSALTPANTDADLAGWSVVARYAESVSSRSAPIPRPDWDYSGMVVGGQPAALVVKQILTGYPVGHVYRFDGSSWKEFASLKFPFGSYRFKVVSTRDGQRSYVLAITTTGVTYAYAVDVNGIRETVDTTLEANQITWQLRRYVLFPTAMLILGLILGGLTWVWMWLFTTAGYGFGTRTIRLASLGRRGVSRLIDMAVIILTTLGFGYLLTIGLNWMSLIEALNLHVDHPTVPVAVRAAWVMAGWLLLSVVTLIVSQGMWGVTPGKWLCRLRTVRTTLRPCGFAPSLAREFVFLLDCCGFLCWTPGILSIALTDQRQRLGDLVAGTIVVDARSLKQGA